MRFTFNPFAFLGLLPAFGTRIENLTQAPVSDELLGPDGYLTAGTGILGNTMDIARKIGHDSLLDQITGKPQHVQSEIAVDNIYRTSAENIVPTGKELINLLDGFGNHYDIDGGHQQDGVHGAHGTVENRHSSNTNVAIYDRQGDFTGAAIYLDVDVTSGEKWMKIEAAADGSGFFSTYGGTLAFFEAGRGNGDKDGEVMVTSLNRYFDSIRQHIDNDGNALNGIQTWDGEHGELAYKVEHDGLKVAGLIDFGPMADPVGTVA